MQNYHQTESRFNVLYSRDNFPKNVKNGAYGINLDEYADIGTYLIALYLKDNKATYFDIF